MTISKFDQSLWVVLQSLWRHIEANRRWQLLFLLILTLVSSLAEVISLGTVLPFIGVITQPEKIYSYVNWVSSFIPEFKLTVNSGIVLFALGFAGASLLAGVLRLFLLWYGIRIGNFVGSDLSVEIYRRTLHQNYSVHISRPSSEIISGISQKTGVATGFLISSVMFFTSAIIFISILIALVVISPYASIIAAICFGAAYSIIAILTRGRLVLNSQCISREQTQTIKALQEGLGAIRDVLLDGIQKVYIDIYKNAFFNLQKANAENTFINQAPRFAMEVIGMMLVAGCVIILVGNDGVSAIQAALPVLAVLALGAQRMLPLLQQLYGNWTTLLGSKASVIDVLTLIDQPINQVSVNVAPLLLKRRLCFENIKFRYSQSTPWVIDGVSFEIHKGARIGIIGSSGSGKSTLLDLLMGLLIPESGSILIDGESLGQPNFRAWQANLAHVPQSIFLIDATIAENIALGLSLDQIDFDRLKLAAQQANIDDFVQSTSLGYRTKVGERGVMLSGGQRQRIGIARALYKRANILIFDEATSALDTTTEKSVMKAIEGLNADLTVLIIAHRFSTLENCNLIIELEHGKIKRQGSHRELCGNL